MFTLFKYLVWLVVSLTGLMLATITISECLVESAIDAPYDEVGPWIPRTMGRLEPLDDGCVLVGSTSNPAMYAEEWLPRVPFRFRIEGGPELRAAMAALVARLAESIEDE